MLFTRLTASHLFFLFFFNDTATTEIYTLSLHDALPICPWRPTASTAFRVRATATLATRCRTVPRRSRGAIPRSRTADLKSTHLNSSHGYISYAVFCLKKKKTKKNKKRNKTKRASDTRHV